MPSNHEGTIGCACVLNIQVNLLVMHACVLVFGGHALGHASEKNKLKKGQKGRTILSIRCNLLSHLMLLNVVTDRIRRDILGKMYEIILGICTNVI